MPTILVTNDDGVMAPGLLALKQALSRIADVVVLGPERNWSASSHVKTMHKPLRIHDVTLADGSAVKSSSGSPTDCVALAAAGVLGVMPDLVVSGINAGHNLGVDVTYSGTVACAMEATIKGIPGIAVSTVFPGQSKCDISVARTVAADVACQVAEDVLRHGLPRYTLLNVNVPGVAHADLKGVHVTRMGGRNYQVSELLERSDPYGQPYYWLGGTAPIDVPDDGSDVGAIHNNFVSVTPITLDMTAYALLDEVKSWQIGMPAQANA
ncbi:MAG: 5'/3'-nucleotidase SurE [Caldilineaceae bacterium]|nr:5'/3'-nucleotidase SurE [Caldilineaceae bacterium]